MKFLILAGGLGTRLWPLSRERQPKQLQSLFKNETLLKRTYLRLRRDFLVKDIFVVTNKKQAYLIKKQIPSLPSFNIILEPEKKNTAAAIGLGAIYLNHYFGPLEHLATINSDHYIEDEKEYLKVIKQGFKVSVLYPFYTVLIGIKPSYIETGYGYIRLGKEIMKMENNMVFRAEQFIEKPSLKKAKNFLKQKKYLWNTGIFVWQIGHLLNLYKKHLFLVYQGLDKIQKSLNKKEKNKIISREFKKIESISIDYGIIEKEKKILVIPAQFGWYDIGSWKTVKDILDRKGMNYYYQGKYIGLQSFNNLVYNPSHKLVATIGIKDMVIVDTDKVLLLCPTNRSQEVKNLVERLKTKKWKQYL